MNINNVIHTHNIFLKSANKTSGNNYNCEFDIPNVNLKCEDYQMMRISLISFSIPQNFYAINKTNNTFQIVDVATNQTFNISLTYGSYTTSILSTSVQTAFNPLSITYDRATSKFTFNFINNRTYRLVFTSAIWKYFGFNSINDTPQGTRITSTQPVELRGINDLAIHLLNIAPSKNQNLDNFSQNTLQISNILALIPIQTTFFDIINYRQLDNSTFGMTFHNKHLTKLKIKITDVNNQEMDYVDLPNWQMVLRLDIINNKDENMENKNIWMDIRDYLRLIFVGNNLSIK